MAPLLFQIFLISFLINLLWELIHSQLYETCLKLSIKKFIPLIVVASLKDGFWISLFFMISVYFFGNVNILVNQLQLMTFIFLSLSFACIDEKISLRYKRWEYSKQMPKIWGVGITPLLELAATGVLTFLYIFL
ncbi:hypothetical protein J4457_00545 [Candidatus Woesearchaeota archaeon]|nr:hypothetical protein [Candidatus Woesearchaeota archaeon]